MKPTELLSKEHELIKIMLQVLGKVCVKLEAEESVPQQHREQIIGFIRGFADKHHHGKEEDLLFGEMMKAGIPKEGGPIGCMLEEHESGRNYVREMNEASDAIESDREGSIDKFVQNARGYIALLTEHIYKEDNVLYPMADASLSEGQQEELKTQFDVFETDYKNSGKKKEFETIVESLKETYLG